MMLPRRLCPFPARNAWPWRESSWPRARPHPRGLPAPPHNPTEVPPNTVRTRLHTPPRVTAIRLVTAVSPRGSPPTMAPPPAVASRDGGSRVGGLLAAAALASAVLLATVALRARAAVRAAVGRVRGLLIRGPIRTTSRLTTTFRGRARPDAGQARSVESPRTTRLLKPRHARPTPGQLPKPSQPRTSCRAAPATRAR